MDESIGGLTDRERPSTAAPLLRPGESFPGHSDERVVNNAMRHAYRVLEDAEKAQMQKLKDMGEAFATELVNMQAGQSNDGTGRRCASYSPATWDWELQNAHRAIEEAVMWAVKHLTK